MKKNIITSSILFVILTIIAIVLDYFNLIGSDNINWDFISLLINNGVVVLLYFFTYCIIDKRTVTKENNQGKTAQVMLKETYKIIKDNMTIWTPELVKTYIVPKANFDTTSDPFVEHLKTIPFQYDEDIIEFAKNGIISDKDFSTYIKIKSEYRNYIGMTITFFDSPNFWNISQQKMERAMKLVEEMINE